MNTTLLAAAISGIMFGASGLAHAHETNGPGFGAATIQQLDGDGAKHGCKVQNDCKGRAPPRASSYGCRAAAVVSGFSARVRGQGLP